MIYATMRALAPGALLMLGVQAQAASFTLIGKTVYYDAPAGYCSLREAGGNAQRLFEHYRERSHSVLVEFLVPCLELAKYQKEEVTFSTMLQLQVGQKDQLRSVQVPRARFVENIAAKNNSQDLRKAGLKPEEQIARKEPNVGSTTTEPEVVGHDDTAMYSITVSRARLPDGEVTTIRSAIATTLVNELPMNILAFQVMALQPDRRVGPSHLLMLMESLKKN